MKLKIDKFLNKVREKDSGGSWTSDYDALTNKPIITIDSPNLDTLLTPWVYNITGIATSSDNVFAYGVNSYCVWFKLTLIYNGNATDWLQLIPILWWWYIVRQIISSVRWAVVEISALQDDWALNYYIHNRETFNIVWATTWKTQLATANTSATDYVATLPAKTGTIAMNWLAWTKVYYVANTSGGSPTRKLTFTDWILTSET